MSEHNIPTDGDIRSAYDAMCQLASAVGDFPSTLTGGFDRWLAAHDAELREQIAQEIEVPMRRHDNAQIGFSAVGDAYADAARIARGKTGEVKRCLQCGCDLRYPTAVHIVDCGPRKEQA